MARRILLAVAVVLFPVSVFAQNDFGVWLNESNMKSTTFSDPGEPTLRLKFDKKVGYGVSFNHFSGANMSTEFAWHQLRADAKASVSAPGINESARLGDLETNQLSGVLKWHFMPRSFIVPYVGAGVGYFTGGKLKTVNDPAVGFTGETIKFDNKFGFIANAGVNFGVTPRIMIGLDLRYSPYKAHEKGTDSSEDVALDPTTIALGVRFRM